MKHIDRYIKDKIIAKLQAGKVVVIYGARQVGKTTLVNKILEEINEEYMYITGESADTRKWMSSESITTLKKNIGDSKFLIIDEAQMIDEIGRNLKLIVDHIPDLKIIATGSSSFELANQVGEPLVGRKWQFNLYPIAQLELDKYENNLETKKTLGDRLIYGAYPEALLADGSQNKEDVLESIIDGDLYKDILAFAGIKKADKIHIILQKLAFQIGKEVSLNEIGESVGLDSRTVESYIDVLEKVFIIKRVTGFSRNLRKEITKTSRYYFYDNGIRNAIIGNFNTLDVRSADDLGQLWENYLFMERLKKNKYKKTRAKMYFWRTWDQKEIDIVEDRGGKLYGYELKWNPKKQPKAPKDWLGTYDNASYEVVNRDNYLEFVT
jgi:predicted AAA+ superfamily ATPase